MGWILRAANRSRAPQRPRVMTPEAYIEHYRWKECFRSVAHEWPIRGTAFATRETPASRQVLADMYAMVARMEEDPELLRAIALEEGVTIS